MSAPYQFSITRTRMVQLVVCVGAIQLLLYSSGVVTGLLLGPKAAGEYTLAKRAEPVRPLETQPAERTAAEQAPAKPASNEVSPKPAAAVSLVKQGDEPAIAAARPVPEAPTAEAQAPAVQNTQPQSATAGNSDPPAQVAIQVASFHTKSNAVRLADVLQREGYGPVVIGESDSGSETWHFVQLGPYKEWDEASRIVAELDRSYSVHAYVRPIRASFN